MGEINWPYLWCPDDVEKLYVRNKLADFRIKANSAVYLRFVKCTKKTNPDCIEDNDKANEDYFGHFYFNLFQVTKSLDF